MGRCPNNKAGGQKKRYLHKRARLSKFLKKGDDMIFDELRREQEKAELGEADRATLNEDLPGMGQWYCLHCDRYFANSSVRDEHNKTKLHKRKVKQMKGPKPHSQLDADLAGGLGAPDNGPRLQASDVAVTMAF